MTGRPSPSDVWRAVEAYLSVAYDGPPPAPVMERLSRLRATPDGAFFDCDAFERSGDRLALRLGNRFYPHMKLVVEASSDGVAHFRADTHDGHVVEALGREDARLAELMERNLTIACAIERAWSSAGLPTPREHWRERLARWHASRP